METSIYIKSIRDLYSYTRYIFTVCTMVQNEAETYSEQKKTQNYTTEKEKSNSVERFISLHYMPS